MQQLQKCTGASASLETNMRNMQDLSFHFISSPSCHDCILESLKLGNYNAQILACTSLERLQMTLAHRTVIKSSLTTLAKT